MLVYDELSYAPRLPLLVCSTCRVHYNKNYHAGPAHSVMDSRLSYAHRNGRRLDERIVDTEWRKDKLVFPTYISKPAVVIENNFISQITSAGYWGTDLRVISA